MKNTIVAAFTFCMFLNPIPFASSFDQLDGEFIEEISATEANRRVWTQTNHTLDLSGNGLDEFHRSNLQGIDDELRWRNQDRQSLQQSLESLEQRGTSIGFSSGEPTRLRITAESPGSAQILDDFWSTRPIYEIPLERNLLTFAGHVETSLGSPNALSDFLTPPDEEGVRHVRPRGLHEDGLEKLNQYARNYLSLDPPKEIRSVLAEILKMTDLEGQAVRELRLVNARAQANQKFWEQLKRRVYKNQDQMRQIRDAIVNGPDELLDGTDLTKSQVGTPGFRMRVSPEDLFKIGENAKKLTQRVAKYDPALERLIPLSDASSVPGAQIQSAREASKQFLDEFQKRSADLAKHHQIVERVAVLEQHKDRFSRLLKENSTLGQQPNVAAAARSQTPSPKKSGGIVGKLKRGLGGAGGILAVGTTLKIFYDLNEARKGKRKEVQIGTRGR